jgi:hypothetical protein
MVARGLGTPHAWRAGAGQIGLGEEDPAGHSSGHLYRDKPALQQPSLTDLHYNFEREETIFTGCRCGGLPAAVKPKLTK